jgi:oligoribonuclease NrnB/cAMP/cGMP phosphodiesterase (DHH superfamily)
MEETLIDDEGMSLARKSVLPGAGFFYPDSLEEQRAERRAAEALAGATAVVVADPDADGLACTALIRAAYGRPTEELLEDVEAALRTRLEDGPVLGETADEDSEGDESDADELSPRERSDVGLIPAEPTEIADALSLVSAHADPGVEVFVCDLCPDAFATIADELSAVLSVATRVRWFDHHQWKPEVKRQVRSAGVDLAVTDDRECTADVVLGSLDYEFPDHLVELAAVTRDHDLWIREDERSDDLADLSYWLDPERYVETVRIHGPDLPPVAREFLSVRRDEKRALIDRAVDRADFREVGPWTVGVTYGRCSQNEVAEALREQGADAAVIVKPAGSASIRGSESFERCHEVARRVNGGGHPKAAGCKPDIYDDMLDYAHHWTTGGAVTKQAILDAFSTLRDE